MISALINRVRARAISVRIDRHFDSSTIPVSSEISHDSVPWRRKKLEDLFPDIESGNILSVRCFDIPSFQPCLFSGFVDLMVCLFCKAPYFRFFISVNSQFSPFLLEVFSECMDVWMYGFACCVRYAHVSWFQVESNTSQRIDAQLEMDFTVGTAEMDSVLDLNFGIFPFDVISFSHCLHLVVTKIFVMISSLVNLVHSRGF